MRDIMIEAKGTEDGQVFVEVGGHLDVATGDKLRAEIDSVYSGTLCDTTLSFKELDFIGSAGFRTLLRLHRELDAAGHKLILRDIPFQIKSAITVLQLDKVLTILE